MAIVAIAPGMFLAHSVVPSSGSTAMSTSGPCLLPTVSPMNSMGASSRSPSPITIVPLMGSLLSWRRMGSTAAWSAAFSLPRPHNRAAETAARSVTRTISSVRTRSSARSGWMVIDGTALRSPLFISSPLRLSCRLAVLRPRLEAGWRHHSSFCEFFPLLYDMRFSQYPLIAAAGAERLGQGVRGGRIGNQDYRHRLAGAAGDIAAMRRLAAVTLHDRLERDVLLRQPLGDGRGGPRFVPRQEAGGGAAFGALHRRLLCGRRPRPRPAERRPGAPPG